VVYFGHSIVCSCCCKYSLSVCYLQLSFIADGNGTLTASLDASVDFSGAHFGTRTTRFAAIVDDGKVTHANVESNPGVMEASDAATILKQL